MPPTPDTPGAGGDPQYQAEQEQIDALANEASANLKEGQTTTTVESKTASKPGPVLPHHPLAITAAKKRNKNG